MSNQMPDNTDIIYRVNSSDQICFANRPYDEFARANDGEPALSSAVLNRSLWSFIADPVTEQLYREVLRRVRSGRTIKFTLRCDSPDCRRLMEMEVVAAADQNVTFRTRLLSQESRPPQAMLERHTRTSDHLLRMCSWCCRVNWDGNWIELEVAARQSGLFEAASPPASRMGSAIHVSRR